MPNENKYSTAKPLTEFNIGNNNPVTLHDFITAIEEACGMKANENLLPMQPGDVPITYADVDELVSGFDYKPSTSVETGHEEFYKMVF